MTSLPLFKHLVKQIQHNPKKKTGEKTLMNHVLFFTSNKNAKKPSNFLFFSYSAMTYAVHQHKVTLSLSLIEQKK